MYPLWVLRCALQSSLLSWIISPHLHTRGSLSGKAFRNWWLLLTRDSWLIRGGVNICPTSTSLFLCKMSFVGCPGTFSERTDCGLVFVDAMEAASPRAPAVILMEVSSVLGFPLLARVLCFIVTGRTGEDWKFNMPITHKKKKKTEPLRVYVKFAHISPALPSPPPTTLSALSLPFSPWNSRCNTQSLLQTEGERDRNRIPDLSSGEGFFFPAFLLLLFFFMKRSLKRDTVR